MADLPPEDRKHIQEQMKGTNGCVMVLLMLVLGIPCAALFDACADRLKHTLAQQTDPSPTP